MYADFNAFRTLFFLSLAVSLYPKVYFLSPVFFCVASVYLAESTISESENTYRFSFTSSRLAEWPKIPPQAPFLLGKSYSWYDNRKGSIGHTLYRHMQAKSLFSLKV